MSGKIDCYLDCVSPYSYFAFLFLTKNREALRAYEVELEFHPIFLGGVNVGSGNKPPWTLPARAKYLGYDRVRAMKYFNTPKLKTPDNFPILSLLPQRAMTYVKAHHPQALYESAFLSLWHALWENNRDVSNESILSEVLGEHFSSSDVDAILKGAKDAKWKQTLNDKTKEALDKGAFGAPWSWVRNAKGQEEPFFGSDRFTFMWEFLGVEWRDVEIVAPGSTKGKAKL